VSARGLVAIRCPTVYRSFGSVLDHCSMPKTLRASLLNITPIPSRRHLPDPPPVPRHHKQAHVPQKANASQDAVNSQVTARRQPRRDTEIDRKRQRVPDQDASRNHLTRQLRVARDGIRQSRRDRYRSVQCHGYLRDGQRKPVQVVGYSETIQDHGEGHEKDAGDEDVEGVLWFGDAVVSAC
jgi:hypothetical protein